MDLNLKSENGEIIMHCDVCGETIKYNFEDRMALFKEVDAYLKLVKKTPLWFEDVDVEKVIKLIGVTSDGREIVAYTDVTEYNKNQINKDLDVIRQLKDTSIILGDDVPSLFLPFEDEGLVCKKIRIEII
jgi:hypothetical protein